MVWVANKNFRRTLDDIPSDIKNPLDEIHFKKTRTHYRGWLVLKSVKCLQANIFFPGCEFNCRLTILGRTVPPDILARGPSPLDAYKNALAYGETSVKRIQLMLIGQNRAGKTTLKNSLKGITFDPEEDSTVGIDVDPSHFKMSTGTWSTGTTNQDKNCDADISCDYHTALIIGKQIVDSVKEERKSTEMEADTDESQYSFDSELNIVIGEPRPSESSKDTEHIQTSRDPEPILSRHEPHVSVGPTERSQEDVNFSTTNVPEEVAVVEESLLRGDLDDNREDIMMWDFAGQSVSYDTHPLFLTSRAIHCLVNYLSQTPHDMAKPLVKQGAFKEKQESSNLMSVICPVGCKGKAVDYCQTHRVEEYKQEQCLHFPTLSELCNAKGSFICTNSASAKNINVQVEQFSPWFSSPGKQLDPSTSTGTSEEVPVQGDPGNSAKALNVTLLASEWGSSMGGLSTINRKLAIQLAKHFKVTLLVPDKACGEEDKRTAESHNIEIREAQSRPGFDDPLDWLNFPPKDLAIDIVLGHGAKLGKQAQIIREFRHDCKTKWAQVVHTAPEELGMHKDYPKAIAKGGKKHKAEVDLCKLADLVVTIGSKLKKSYSSYLRSCKTDENIIQLTPGIFHEFTTVEQVARDGGTFKVLTFGRGDPEDFSLKGYDIAAKAVNELKNSTLVFVGAPNGKEEEVAEKLLQCGISEDHLIVRGFVEGEERLKELFCEVDLAIMPSRTEGFGLTALEALSAGLPILVSANSGFSHALRDLPSGNAFVVESKDPNDWAKAIDSVRQKGRAQRLQEIQTLRTSYEEKYSWEDQCGALVEKLRSMALED